MPIPSAPTGTPASVEACDCCTLGNPAAVPPRVDDFMFDDFDDSIDSFLSDSFIIAGPGGDPTGPDVTPSGPVVEIGGEIPVDNGPFDPEINTRPAGPVREPGGGVVIQ